MIPESEDLTMKRHYNSIYYPETKCAAGMTCSLCGQHCDQQFKHGFVCEDCLKYVKTHC